MNDFRAEPRELREAELGAIRRVLDSGWYVLGPEVEAFEREWAAACGVRFVVGVGNGLDAISIGLRCLGLGAGDEVITTPMTAFATVLAIMQVGATPVLADIEPGTALLNLESADRCLTERTRAIVPVHLYGRIAQIDRWQSFCSDASIALVEDCAQAHMARWHGGVAGTFGAFGAYSFYPTKNLGARGDAGALVTNDEEIAQRAARLRNYGQSERYYHPDIGLNSRLDELQAALLRERLRWLDDFTERRRRIAQRLLAGIDNPLVMPLPPPADDEQHVFHLFVVICEERDRLANHLRRYGIQTLIHYPVAVHRQAPCLDVRRDPEGLIAAERHAQRCLSLPCHPFLTNGDADRIIEAINDYR